MGVKDLWNVLAPVCQKTSLYDLQDKTIAIDLSCWVCEGQCIGEKVAATQPRMYLRNLYFRTHALLLMNVTPVFVLDGDAPELKLDAMKQRNNARFKHRQQNDGENKSTNRRKGGRSRFKGLLKLCSTMLELMGVTCLQSDGEAEALCGQLSNDGVVDGVITQDSDVFLYGAKTVYRNLVVKAGTGTIECYQMKDIEDKLRLTREKLVAMSLLCGCDYDQAGVHGIGKETASKYLMNFDGDILTRLKTLRTDRKLIRYEEEKEGCSKCSHPGKLSEHKKTGCLECGIEKGCVENGSPLAFKNLSEDDRKMVSLELSLRRKAISEPDFPNQETINEFLHTFQAISNRNFIWKKPVIPKFCTFCSNMMEWELEYGFEKVLPLLTRWQLIQKLPLDTMELVPSTITKKRVVKGVPSFDVLWNVNDENIKGFLSLLPDDCKVVEDGLCLTTEPQAAISERMPLLYDEFIERTTKKKKPKGEPKKKKNVKAMKKNEVELVEAIDKLSLTDGCSNTNVLNISDAQVSKNVEQYWGTKHNPSFKNNSFAQTGLTFESNSYHHSEEVDKSEQQKKGSRKKRTEQTSTGKKGKRVVKVDSYHFCSSALSVDVEKYLHAEKGPTLPAETNRYPSSKGSSNFSSYTSPEYANPRSLKDLPSISSKACDELITGDGYVDLENSMATCFTSRETSYEHGLSLINSEGGKKYLHSPNLISHTTFEDYSSSPSPQSNNAQSSKIIDLSLSPSKKGDLSMTPIKPFDDPYSYPSPHFDDSFKRLEITTDVSFRADFFVGFEPSTAHEDKFSKLSDNHHDIFLQETQIPSHNSMKCSRSPSVSHTSYGANEDSCSNLVNVWTADTLIPEYLQEAGGSEQSLGGSIFLDESSIGSVSHDHIESDESTVDYDISQIVEDIVSRKRIFY